MRDPAASVEASAGGLAQPAYQEIPTPAANADSFMLEVGPGKQSYENDSASEEEI